MYIYVVLGNLCSVIVILLFIILIKPPFFLLFCVQLFKCYILFHSFHIRLISLRF